MTLQNPPPEEYIVNSTENLMGRANSLLSRYRLAPLERAAPSNQATLSDFPILTEVVANPDFEELGRSEATRRIDGESATFPPQKNSVDAFDPIAGKLRHQLTVAISQVLSARLDALSSELIAAVLKASLGALDETMRKSRTTDLLDPEGQDGSKR